ncbi:hypothetical protein IAT38_006169 [Cryptococcus sp. DSM 104549]
MAIPLSPPPPATTTPAAPATPGLRYHLHSTLSARSRGITALKFSQDGCTLVSAGADGWLHFWDAETGEHRRGLRAHKTGINDITLSPDSLYLATASDDHTSTIHLLSPTLDLLIPPPASAPSPSSTPAHPSTSTSTPTPAPGPGPDPSTPSHPPPIRILASHTAPVLSAAYSPKGNLLVTGSFDESAIIWDVRQGGVLRMLPAHADAVWCVGWDAEGGMVLTGSADGLIAGRRLWDANSGQCLKTLDNDTNSPVSHASFTPSSFFLLASTLSSTLRIYNIHTSKVLKTIRAPGVYVSERWPCPAVIFEAPEGERFGVGKVEDLPEDRGDKMDVDGEPPTAAPTPASAVTTKLRRDAWVISGSENGKLVIWDIQSKKVLQVLEGEGAHSAPVVALAVHPDGKTIASGAIEPDKSIKLWRTGS